MSTIPCTVAVLTFNSGRTLRRTLESVRNFEEIIVCDGGSTDDTNAIAKEFGARIIAQDLRYKRPDGSIADFSGIRNQTLQEAHFEWFLFIDSDEYLSDAAAEEIFSIVTAPTDSLTLAFWLPRKRVYNGEIVEHSTTYPSYQMRFFNKKGVTTFAKPVHERIQVRDGVRVGYLKNCEYVPFESTKEEWIKKLNYYIQLEAGRFQNQTFWHWVSRSVYTATRISVLYGVRFVYISIFCRGTKMPLWYEMLQYWYHWKLVLVTGKKFLPFSTGA